jgi:hypothetical protein
MIRPWKDGTLQAIRINANCVIYSIAFLFRIAFYDLLDFSVFERILVMTEWIYKLSFQFLH